jgi:DNA-binding transcriptional LysR family regulator
MDLSALRYLDAVARHGSLTAAAKALHVAQPTLTLAMRNLEKRFNTTLLVRTRSGVSLTPSGEELVRHTQDIFAILERAEQRIHGLQTDEVGRFVLGCHESLGAYFLPGFLIDFMESAPQIELTLWNGSSASVIDAVVRREVHFGLSVNPIPHPDLVLLELFRDAMDLVTLVSDDDANHVTEEQKLAAAHALLKKGPIIFAGRVPQCQELLGRLAAEELLPARQVSCGDLELTKSMILGGLGVGVLPRRVAAYNAMGKIRRVHPSLPFVPDTIFLLFRADMPKTRGFLRLKEALVAHGRKLGPAEMVLA